MTGEESGRTSASGSRLGLNLGQVGQGRTGRGRVDGLMTTSFHSEGGAIDEDEEEVLGDNVWDSSPGRAVPGARGGPSSSASLSNSPSVTFQTGHLSTDRGRASRTGTNASTSPVLGLPRRSESRSASRPAGTSSGSPLTANATLRTGGRRGSSSTRRAPSGTAAGVVFMGVWVLAGVRWGSSSSTSMGMPNRASGEVGLGRVISRHHVGSDTPWSTRSHHQATESETISLSFAETPVDPPSHDDDDGDHPDHSRRWDKPAIQRLIGRMSDWICTTLYLTSRLPQIWKNVSPGAA